MKKWILILMSLASIGAQAHRGDESGLETLECRLPDLRHGWARLVLDPTGYVEGSGYKAPVKAQLVFNYSASNNMSCMGIVRGDRYDVNCVGYYHLGREIVEAKFRNRGEKIIAQWRTSRVYNSQPMESECVLNSHSEET